MCGQPTKSYLCPVDTSPSVLGVQRRLRSHAYVPKSLRAASPPVKEVVEGLGRARVGWGWGWVDWDRVRGGEVLGRGWDRVGWGVVGQGGVGCDGVGMGWGG